MNRPFQYLIIGSIAALLCAIVGAMWLVWHSLQESRTLERQNRELQASLEASRIRVENFCEYPSDVLCKVDVRTGSVAGVMDGLEPLMDKDASLAVKHQKAVASVQVLLAAAADVKPSVEQKSDTLLGSVVPEAESKKAVSQEVQTEKNKTEKIVSPALVKMEAKAESKIETKLSVPATPEADTEKPAEKSATAAPATEKTAEAPALTPAAVPSASVAKASAEKPDMAPAVPAAPVMDEAPSASASESRLEISGKLNLLPDEPEHEAAPAEAEKKESTKPAESKTVPAVKAAPVVKVSASPAPKAKAVSPADVRKSWSKVEHDGENFGFTITGAGDSLPASGELLTEPWRYELTLKGSWAIQTHSNVENRLVKKMRIARRGGNTVIIFQLKQKPYRCSLHRPDKRTVTVRIR
ncbi:hypothetical protein [Mailhella sp.]|uniref:hypothetical protein n=1 Tax=Mailhella sp. TaxID=1981029 RepID=UPI004062FBE1